jgi:hypothetical protein
MAQRTPRKKRALRSPFLITVAALAGAAVVPACGGNVGGAGSSGAGGSTGTGGGATGGGTGTGGSGGGTEISCPVIAPDVGTGCASEGQTCDYGACFSGDGSIYHCQGGVWKWTSGGCNPPPPWQEVCPNDKPAEGAGCYVNPVLKCSYVASYCCGSPNGTVDFYCQEYAWHSTGGSIGTCNPPAPTCPSAVPTEGQPCCFMGPAEGCNYGCGYYLGATYRATCDGSQWHVAVGSSCNPPPPCWDGGCVVPIEDAGAAVVVDAAPE